jgi:hypothetical protein
MTTPRPHSLQNNNQNKILKAPDWGITCYNKVIAKKKNFPEGGITMRNLAKVLMMAMVVLAGAITASAKTTTSVETMTLDEAAQKFYKAEQKAGETKKDKTVTVKVAGTKKNKFYKASEIDDKFRAKFFKDVTNKRFISDKSSKVGIWYDGMTGVNGKAKTTFSNGVVVIKVTFKGSKCYKVNSNLTAAKANLAEFESRIVAEQPQTQREIAWFCAKFVSEHAKMNFANRKTNNEVGFSKKKAGGDCLDCAQWIVTYMGYAGVKKYGIVQSKKANHAWNYVKEDGVKYYFEASISEDVLKGTDTTYSKLINVASEEDLSNVYAIVTDSAVEKWTNVQAAGSEANYYVMTEKSFRKLTGIGTNDWVHESWKNR